jgi:hypothetical protein
MPLAAWAASAPAGIPDQNALGTWFGAIRPANQRPAPLAVVNARLLRVSRDNGTMYELIPPQPCARASVVRLPRAGSRCDHAVSRAHFRHRALHGVPGRHQPPHACFRVSAGGFRAASSRTRERTSYFGSLVSAASSRQNLATRLGGTAGLWPSPRAIFPRRSPTTAVGPAVVASRAGRPPIAGHPRRR